MSAKKPDASEEFTTQKGVFSLEPNTFVADDATGTLNFPMGQVVSDDTVQRSGTHYDIETMDLSEFNGSVTADHVDMIQSVIAKTKLTKRGNQVIMNSLQFCVNEDPFAQIAYDKYKGGYVKDFSIETYGSPPDETGLMTNSKLVGLSAVVTGNNKSATINTLVKQSLATARDHGLDISQAEEALGVKADEPKPKEAEQLNTGKDDMKFVTKKNSREFAVEITYKNAAGDEVKTELAPGATIDLAEEQAEAFDKQLSEAKDPAADTKQAEAIKKAVETALEAQDAKNKERFDEMEKNLLEATSKEPEFKKGGEKNHLKDTDKELAAMDWEERTAQQIESARLMLTNHSIDAQEDLNRINKFHVEALKEKGVVKNSVNLSSFGNFVTSPELLTEIEGVRSDYSPLVDAVGFTETLSLQMAWLKRNGDIAMQEVGTPANPTNTLGTIDVPEGLKPISTYSATPQVSNMMEVAAVTPVSNAATRFLAVDLLSDVAGGYRTAYQKMLAQIVVARLQQAVTATGNHVPYHLDTAVNGLVSLVNAVKTIANSTANGTFIMGVSTEWELFAQALRANLTGDSLGLFQKGPNGMTFMNRPYVVVPDDILPPINSTTTLSFTVEGVSVTIDQAIFYADLSTISGRVSGGLNYSLSTEAAYEDSGVVKSAFQRDELLLRGYFYRNAAVRNNAKVGSVYAAGIS